MENKQHVLLYYSYANKRGKVLSLTPAFVNSLLISTKNEKKEMAADSLDSCKFLAINNKKIWIFQMITSCNNNTLQEV